MEETSIFSVALWCHSIAGWARIERTNAETVFLGTNLDDEIQEIWVPAKEDESRKTSVPTAVVNLVSTSVCGCGIVMMPLVFERCGIGVATCLLIGTAAISDQALVLLCLCTRRAGVGTYAQVAQVAFSSRFEKVIFGVWFLFLLVALALYNACIRDILVPPVQELLQLRKPTWILLALILCTTPLIIQRDMYRLRFANVLSILGILVFAVSLCWMACTDGNTNDGHQRQSEPSRATFDDLFYGLPIVTMGFLCSFNILPIQSTLAKPSPEKMNLVIHVSILASMIIMFVVGVAGRHFLIRYGKPEDQAQYMLQRLLSSTSSKSSDLFEKLSLAASTGYGVSILLNSAMVLLPCRDSILEIVQRVVADHEDHCHRFRKRCPEDCCEDEDADEETCMTFPSLPSVPSRWSDQSEGDLYVVNEGTRLLPRIVEESPPRCKIMANPVFHFPATALILLIGFLGSLLIRDIQLTLRLSGATIGLLFAFCLPSACYLSIQDRLPSVNVDGMGILSWILIVTSTPIVVVCVTQIFFDHLS